MNPELTSGPATQTSPTRSRKRGLLAVVMLLITAVDDLVTAVIGCGPLIPRMRRLSTVIADEYRAGAEGWVEVEVDDPNTPYRR